MQNNEIRELITFAYYFLPFIILSIGSIIVSIITLFRKYLLSKIISYITLILSISISIYFLIINPKILFFNSLIAIDNFTLISWVALIIGAIIALASMGEDLLKKETQPLLLLSLAASLIVVSVRDLLLLFIAIETSVFPAYVLVAQFKRDYFSLEATVKFFIFGVLATLLFAYGLTIIYGITGNTSFSAINSFLSESNPEQYASFLILGLIFILASLAIKSTLVPLHVWAIDTYQGSPTTISVFLSTTSKLTGLISVALILTTAFSNIFNIAPIMRYILAILALATMILPNIAALVQRNIKRLLAYSSVAHAGYMSLVFVFPKETFPILGYYAVTYSIAKSLSFLVTKKITGEGSESPYNSLVSLFKYEPLTATSFTVSLLSLAGIPPFAGFMAKFLLFLNTAFTGNLGVFLALVALIMSGVSVYYYAYLIRLEIIESNQVNNLTYKSLEMDIVMIISIILLILLTFFPSYLYYEFPIF